jgi:hypothetical protein
MLLYGSKHLSSYAAITPLRNEKQLVQDDAVRTLVVIQYYQCHLNFVRQRPKQLSSLHSRRFCGTGS